mmetsp:Transcript_63379/g.182434  ORF Transcript_63379/g.182434 Transcript_63379/m.182434 type:complete len:270 (+) Transcript_63379:89-898(+)
MHRMHALALIASLAVLLASSEATPSSPRLIRRETNDELVEVPPSDSDEVALAESADEEGEHDAQGNQLAHQSAALLDVAGWKAAEAEATADADASAEFSASVEGEDGSWREEDDDDAEDESDKVDTELDGDDDEVEDVAVIGTAAGKPRRASVHSHHRHDVFIQPESSENKHGKAAGGITWEDKWVDSGERHQYDNGKHSDERHSQEHNSNSWFGEHQWNSSIWGSNKSNSSWLHRSASAKRPLQTSGRLAWHGGIVVLALLHLRPAVA